MTNFYIFCLGLSEIFQTSQQGKNIHGSEIRHNGSVFPRTNILEAIGNNNSSQNPDQKKQDIDKIVATVTGKKFLKDWKDPVEPDLKEPFIHRLAALHTGEYVRGPSGRTWTKIQEDGRYVFIYGGNSRIFGSLDGTYYLLTGESRETGVIVKAARVPLHIDTKPDVPLRRAIFVDENGTVYNETGVPAPILAADSVKGLPIRWKVFNTTNGGQDTAIITKDEQGNYIIYDNTNYTKLPTQIDIRFNRFSHGLRSNWNLLRSFISIQKDLLGVKDGTIVPVNPNIRSEYLWVIKDNQLYYCNRESNCNLWSNINTDTNEYLSGLNFSKNVCHPIQSKR